MDGIFLLLGTNLGDKRVNLTTAIRLLEFESIRVVDQSSIYQTAAWGITNQEDFLNQVIEIETSLKPRDLLKVLLDVEQKMGRKRIEKWGSRIIDIDILYYKNEVVDEKALQIPHPGIPSRRFTLIPLVELMADGLHPILKLSQKELLDRCEDHLEVLKVNS